VTIKGRVRFPGRGRVVSLCSHVQIGSGVHPIGTGGVKLTTHLHLVREFKNTWSYNSTLPMRLYDVVLN